jgi:membrane-bound hydrogenase subunit mbhJ
MTRRTETSARALRTSLFLRHVDGGSSGLCECELTALTSPVYDLAQYGIRFVASPRHADALLLTGPLTRNMLAPTVRAFEVMCEPRAVVTVGDAADFARLDDAPRLAARRLTDLFEDSYATATLPESLRRAVLAHVPGDPPEPSTIVEALLDVARAVRRLRSQR